MTKNLRLPKDMVWIPIPDKMIRAKTRLLKTIYKKNKFPEHFNFLFLNGPSKSGKDALYKQLAERHSIHRTKTYLYDWSPADSLKAAVHSMFGYISPTADESFEINKDINFDKLFGCIPRLEYIALSGWAKHRYGKDHWAWVAARKAIYDLSRLTPNVQTSKVISVCTSHGFREELEPFIKIFGPEKIGVIRLKRKGTSFRGDSREYIPTEYMCAKNIKNIDLINREGELVNLADRTIKILKKWKFI